MRFRAGIGAGAVFALDDALVLRPLRIVERAAPAAPHIHPKLAALDTLRARGANIWLRLPHAGAVAAPRGTTLLSGTVGYFRGSDASGWVSGLPRFSGVAYADALPGIDVAFELEADGLRPCVRGTRAALAAGVELALDGAEWARADGAHGAVLGAGEVAIRVLAPRIELVQPAGVFEPAAGAIRIDSASALSLELADGPPPPAFETALVYSKFLGGEGYDIAFGVDAWEGTSPPRAFVCGYTASTTFVPALPGTFDTTLSGTFDALVAKYAASSGGLTYANYLGGSADDHALAIRVDASGQAFVAGITSSNDFPTTSGALDTSYSGGTFFGHDAFVVAFDAAGSSLLASTYFGGSGDDQAFGLDLDASGNVYLGGLTLSYLDFPLQHALQSTYNLTGLLHSPPDSDGFLTSLTSDLATLRYSTFVAGMQSEVVFDVAVDDEARAHVIVETNSTYMLTQNPIQSSGQGGDNAWIGSYEFTPSPAALSLVYGTFLCGSSPDSGHAIAVDDEGLLYTAGYTSSSNFPVSSGAFDTSFSGSGCGTGDMWVAKIDWADTTPSGGLVYATFLGGSSCDNAWDIATDGGLAFVVGETTSSDYPTTSGAYDTTYYAEGDVALTVVSSNGTSLVSSTYLGARRADSGQGVATEAGGAHAYVVGSTASEQFPVTGVYLNPPYQGATDAFVTKIDVP